MKLERKGWYRTRPFLGTVDGVEFRVALSEWLFG